MRTLFSLLAFSWVLVANAQTVDYSACVTVTISSGSDPAFINVNVKNNCSVKLNRVEVGLKSMDSSGVRVYETSPGQEMVFLNLMPGEQATVPQPVDWAAATPMVREVVTNQISPAVAK